MRVSILVFLDQALKAAQEGEGAAGVAGFNPCFPGSSAERRCGKEGGNPMAKFQSLFSWIKR